MCNQCKKNLLLPELEYMLEQEYETAVLTEPRGNIPHTPYTQEVGNGSKKTFLYPSENEYELKAPNYLTSSSEEQIIRSAILSGETNETSLTDKIFFRRHPELISQPLYKGQPGYEGLSKEWSQILEGLVRPLLAPGTGTDGQPGRPGGSRKITLNRLLSAMKNKGYIIYDKPYQLNIVGVRSPDLDENTFNDTINIFYKDGLANWNFRSCPATSDPGRVYRITPYEGTTATGILKTGQYINSHKRGLHRNSYLALTQVGPVTLFRDGNRDAHLDLIPGSEVTGLFGINIHRASSTSIATAVDTYSAGCQVFQVIDDFNFMMKMSEEHEKRYDNLFTYTLIDERDLPVSDSNKDTNKYSKGAQQNILSWPAKMLNSVFSGNNNEVPVEGEWGQTITNMATKAISPFMKWVTGSPAPTAAPIPKPATAPVPASPTLTTAPTNPGSLTVSKATIDAIVKFEVASKEYYEKNLRSPVWPSGKSGITIGIGYDLGYQSEADITSAWKDSVPSASLAKILSVRGLTGEHARDALAGIKDVVISFEIAQQVFIKTLLPKYAKLTRDTYPGTETLFPDAQGALASLVYNRGGKLTGTGREEMLSIKSLVARKDYKGIAAQMRSMKRLWNAQTKPFLIKRRETEAVMIENANRSYSPEELLRV